jgi:hypothetical protein
MSTVLDAFIPDPDVHKRHSILVRAPAAVVLNVARQFDMQSVPLIRAIFNLRGRVLGARVLAEPATLSPANLLRMGWGTLAERPGHFFIAGAACQPWQANVVFTPISSGQFRTYVESDRVKIAWTLEAESLGAELTRFATETRAVATDDAARNKFRRYWRLFGIGIVAIRWLLLPAIRREAERRWRALPERVGSSSPKEHA